MSEQRLVWWVLWTMLRWLTVLLSLLLVLSLSLSSPPFLGPGGSGWVWLGILLAFALVSGAPFPGGHQLRRLVAVVRAEGTGRRLAESSWCLREIVGSLMGRGFGRGKR